GARVHRVEDPKFLTGRGRYLDDLAPPDLLQAHFVRSPHAHARLTRIDLSPVRALPGVVAAWGGADLAAAVRPLRPALQVPGAHTRAVWPRALGRVRFGGEPVAVLVAESRYVAEDVADHVAIEYEPLPAVVDARAALDSGAALVHDDLPDNRLFEAHFAAG